MSRTFIERLKDKDWWLEQTAHWWVGDVIGSITGGIIAGAGASWMLSGIGAVIAGAFSGAAREMIQNLGDDSNNIPDSIADWFFWTLGAVRASALFFVAHAAVASASS